MADSKKGFQGQVWGQQVYEGLMDDDHYSPKVMNRSCLTCQYVLVTPVGHRCRLYPPSNTREYLRYPRVYEDDWCYQYQWDFENTNLD